MYYSALGFYRNAGLSYTFCFSLCPVICIRLVIDMSH